MRPIRQRCSTVRCPTEWFGAAEAAQTNVCTLLSAAWLVGLSAKAILGWWWADPIAGLAIAGVSAWMHERTFTADSLEHTCCG